MENVVRIDGSVVEQQQNIGTVVFKNKGELDIRAIKTMGMSVKEEGAIGYFGTGLKYAIAVLMREGQEVEVWSGGNKYLFEKKKINFRDKDFDLITMNGEELPFTTELGKNWEIWQAFRELYCNCTDEHGEITRAQKNDGEKGSTIIYVTGDKITDAFDSRGETILLTEKWDGDDKVAIHVGNSNNVFYRGVRVHKTKPSLFTYNILKDMELTEDRTAKYFWKPRERIMNMALQSSNKMFIKSILTAPDNYYEHEFNFCDKSEATAQPSGTFLEVCEGLNGKDKINRSAIELCKQYRLSIDGMRPKSVCELTKVKQKQLDIAVDFCSEIGFKLEHQIVVTDSLGNNVLGLAENDTIYLNIRVFSLGVKTIVATLIEEHIHLKYELKDESRDLQNFLFEKVVDMGTEMTGKVL